MVHVAVNDNCSAIFHQETFVVEVIFKARSSIGPIWSGVMLRKNTYIKGQTIDSMNKIGLARDFHYKMGSSILNSLSHHVKRSIFQDVEKEDLKKVSPSRVVFIVDKRAVG